MGLTNAVGFGLVGLTELIGRVSVAAPVTHCEHQLAVAFAVLANASFQTD